MLMTFLHALLFETLCLCFHADSPNGDDYLQVFRGTFAEKSGFLDKNNPTELAIAKLCEQHWQARFNTVEISPKDIGRMRLISQENFVTQLTQLTSPTIDRKVAVGLLLMEGQLGLTKVTVKKHIGMLEKDHPALEVLKKHYAQFDDDLTHELEQYLKPDYRMLSLAKANELIESRINKADKALEQALLPVLTREQREQYLSLLREAKSTRIELPKKKWNESAYFVKAPIFRRLGLVLERDPLRHPSNLLRLATIKKTQELAAFTTQDADVVLKINKTYLKEYEEINNLYQNEPPEKTTNRFAIKRQYEKITDEVALRFDKQLEQQLSNASYKRLLQIEIQILTPCDGFSQIRSHSLFDKYLDQMKPSREQFHEFGELRSKFDETIRNWSFSNQWAPEQLNEKVLAEHHKLAHQLYQTIMTDVQRQLWDKMAGQKLPDDVLIKIKVELSQSNK